MAYLVTTNITGPVYYLRSTTWTSERDRATRFADMTAAREAIAKARQFNPRAARAARILVEHPPLAAADIAARQASYPKARED